MQNVKEKILKFFLIIPLGFLFITIIQVETRSESLEESLPNIEGNDFSTTTLAIFSADKSVYRLFDTIKIFNAKPKSAIEIYWLDNPETANNPDPESKPSNVYAILVNDEGTVEIDASTLAPGNYILVNTLDPEHCGGLYLSQCRSKDGYLGELSLTIIP